MLQYLSPLPLSFQIISPPSHHFLRVSQGLRLSVTQLLPSFSSSSSLSSAVTNNELLASDNPALDTPKTDNNSEMKREAEQKKLHSIANVHDILEMWQGSNILCATQKESHVQIQPLTAKR